MFSHLDKEGLYDQSRRYRFTNVDDEEFIGMWDSKVYVRVPVGESVTLPESQAINFAKDLATRVMIKDEKRKYVPTQNAPTYEESQKSRVGIPAARDPYEKRILQLIEQGEETPEMQALRSELRDEVMRDLKGVVSTAPPSGPSSREQLAVVGDVSRPGRSGHEFEGLAALK